MKQPFTNLIVDEGDIELLHYALAEFMQDGTPDDWQVRAIQLQYLLNQKMIELQGDFPQEKFGIEGINPSELEGGK